MHENPPWLPTRCRSLALPALMLLACHAPAATQKPPPAPSAPPMHAQPEALGEAAPTLPSQRVHAVSEALSRIREEGLRRDVETLASDAFEGRAPGTPGEERTLAYLSESFRELGLEPLGEGGSYGVRVPLLGAQSTPEARFRAGKKQLVARTPEELVAHSRTGLADVKLHDLPMVFVGYGVAAPEYDWDDFKGVDVRGKLVVMLVGDPPVTLASDPGKLDGAAFHGRALTYYGRWTYKYEVASARGAAGVLLVHDTEAAGYPYDVVKTGAAKEQLMLRDEAAFASRVRVEGWMTTDFARSLFALSGQDFDALKARAATRAATPVSLTSTADVRVRSALRSFDSHNLVAALRGGQGPLRDEAVMLTAHWDHFGRNEHQDGDGIFNGAIDNASGVASLLAIARALVSLPERPQRTILFVSTTAEESGLLGAQHYANHPSFPLERTVADINMDCMNLWGKARTLVSVGLGSTSLDDWLESEARLAGRRVMGDLEPEKGYFFRSDHLELMKKGIPALHFLHPGADYAGKSEAESMALRSGYVASAYHKVSDEALPTLRYDGAVDDARLITRVVLDVANAAERPTFKAGGAGFMPK